MQFTNKKKNGFLFEIRTELHVCFFEGFPVSMVFTEWYQMISTFKKFFNYQLFYKHFIYKQEIE